MSFLYQNHKNNDNNDFWGKGLHLAQKYDNYISMIININIITINDIKLIFYNGVIRHFLERKTPYRLFWSLIMIWGFLFLPHRLWSNCYCIVTMSSNYALPAYWSLLSLLIDWYYPLIAIFTPAIYKCLILKQRNL